jgi:signal transduction histidine kinase
LRARRIERQRIARELHDDVSQRIALLNIEIDQISAQAVSEESRARLRTLSAQARDVATDVHRMSYALHPSWLETLGLVAALQSLCREVSKQRNLRVAFTHASIPSLIDANVSLCVYRIVQEALHNVARHSRAREAHVSVTSDGSDIALQVSDSGIGFDSRHVRGAGLGLASMRERVAVLNGQLVINAGAGRRNADHRSHSDNPKFRATRVRIATVNNSSRRSCRLEFHETSVLKSPTACALRDANTANRFPRIERFIPLQA